LCDNRTWRAARIPGSAKSQRVGYRVCRFLCESFVILSAALAPALWGIENKVEPDPVSGRAHAYERNFPDRLAASPRLWEAAPPEVIDMAR